VELIPNMDGFKSVELIPNMYGFKSIFEKLDIVHESDVMCMSFSS